LQALPSLPHSPLSLVLVLLPCLLKGNLPPHILNIYFFVVRNFKSSFSSSNWLFLGTHGHSSIQCMKENVSSQVWQNDDFKKGNYKVQEGRLSTGYFPLLI
jgi:hypothetical protein